MPLPAADHDSAVMFNERPLTVMKFAPVVVFATTPEKLKSGLVAPVMSTTWLFTMP